MPDNQKPANFRLASNNKILKMVCGGLWLCLSISNSFANADQAARNYHIPAQALDSSLLRLAADSGLEILFTADKVRGLSGNSVNGSMTSAEALTHILQDSGMTYRFVDAKTVTIQPATGNFIKTAAASDNPNGQAGGEGQMMPKVTVEADSNADNPYLDPNWAIDPYNSSYNRPGASNASKTNTPLAKSPMSVQVVPKSVFNDQKSARVKDVLENVSGVRPQTSLGLGTRFIVRGFENPRIYRNGLLSNAADSFFVTELDTANLENIEVLKGPAGMLFGRSEPGGLINMVTKRPLDVPFYSLEQQFGSYDHYRTIWDASGPIDKDKKLLYRFSGSYQDTGSFRDFVSSDRIMVNPALTWRISDQTEFNIEVEGFEQDFQGNLGVPAIGNRPARIPISRSFSDPNEPRDSVSKVHLGTELTHKFNEDWMVRNRFSGKFPAWR